MKKSLYRQVMFVISSICLILLITIAVKIGVFSELTSCVWIESILSVINNSYFSGVLCSIIAVIVIYFFQVQYSKRMLKKDVRCNEIIQDVYDGIEKYCNISNTIPERTSKNEEKDYSKRQIADGLMYYKFYKEYEVDFEMMAYSLSCENNDILIESLQSCFFLNLNFKLLNIVNNIKNRLPNIRNGYPEIKEIYVSISDSIKRIDKEFGPKRDLLLMDNNVLRSPKFDQIIDEIKALGFEKGATFVNPKTGKTVVRHVDFNQGLDAFLLNEHKAQRLGELAIKPARIAFDHIEDEDVYVRAITLCARAGIDHMSNYLLYNGEDFTGKGHSYHADTPEDLFYRMHLTMELGENLTEELGRKIAIFSFPMRYIPLDNDQRGFIGANWNAKYLRALQCMLIPTQGKGIQGRSFFEADFGKTAEDFVMYLAMPERLLNKRGHFVERKDEPKFEREIRYTQWSENRHLIDTWMKYYSMFEKDTVLEYIGCNRFSVETLDKIENEELKKLYFLYLTPSATIRVFSDCTEDTKRIISTFILEELPFMYSRIVETILSSKPGYKVIAGILENFGEKVCTDLLKKIDLFSGHDNDKLTMLIKANKSKRLVDFDFSLLQFIPYFHVSNLLSKQEEQIIMNSAYELKEAPIRKILLLHLDELKDVLIKTNGAQPGNTQIISVIEEQIKELYHQISIFEL